MQKQRVTPHTWQAEMLCEHPSRSDSVYPEFDPALHVIEDRIRPVSYETCHKPHHESHKRFNTAKVHIGGIDFGHRAPTVILWARVDDAGVIEIVDELYERDRTTDELIKMANEKSAAIGFRPQWIGADPAGHQRNDQTGRSTISCWQRAGWRLRTRGLAVEAGVEAVRARLRRADGFVGLRIHRRCRNLIEAMVKYHYPQNEPDSGTPVKDGPDHACDALRYMITNLDHEGSSVKCRPY